MRTFAARSHLNNIPYPSRLTEFESHALIYNYLRGVLAGSGYTVHCDVKAECSTTISRRKGCRFDLVIFSPRKKPVIIIEIKRQREDCRSDTRQIERYRSYGVPLIYFWDLRKLQDLKGTVKRLIANHKAEQL